MLDQVQIMLTGDIQCLATNPTSSCLLTIIEDVSRDTHGSVLILISLLHATRALNQELWSRVSFLLTTGLLWSSLEATCSAAVRRMPKTSLASQNARSLSNRACLEYMMGRRLRLPENADELAQQLEEI
ncbi:uncharacterized protein TNCV_4867151 [Trichonephila clavipes]|nr:uncharacterized protein TNCV_4867151 [Trichonephila clavipes]